MKRVLVINAIQMGEPNGTGNTLNNIFSAYPKDKLLQLLVIPEVKQYFSDIKTINTGMAVCRFPYQIMKRRQAHVDNAQAGILVGGVVKGNNTKEMLHEVLKGILDSWPVFCKSLYKEIDEFKPEVIYTCAANIRIMKVVRHVAKHYSIPVVVHLMDDWPKTLYTTSLLSLPFRINMKHQLKQLYKMSDVNYAITEGLGKKYSEKYSRRHITLMNPTKVEGYFREEREADTPIRFLYAGSLSLRRDESLLAIADVLQKLDHAGLKNEFDLYIPPLLDTEETKSRFLKYGAKIYSYVPANEVYELYVKYDVLVFTESFLPEIIEFTTLSLSTKIPEYLAAGVPMLAYLPESLYSSMFLRRNQVAQVANDMEALKNACKKLISNKDLRKQLSENAYQLAEREFSYHCVWNKLKEVFEE